MTQDIRWQQRFENFDNSLVILHKAIAAVLAEKDNDLYKMALIKAFEISFELGWKTLKDYLEYNSISLSIPREIIKHAYNMQLISNGQAWIDILDGRNLMSHVYDNQKSIEVCEYIINLYVKEIEQVHSLLKSKLEE